MLSFRPPSSSKRDACGVSFVSFFFFPPLSLADVGDAYAYDEQPKNKNSSFRCHSGVLRESERVAVKEH
jgi:hypothetical protein